MDIHDWELVIEVSIQWIVHNVIQLILMVLCEDNREGIQVLSVNETFIVL